MIQIAIRQASATDVAELALLLREFHAEMPMLPLSNVRMMETINSLLERGMILLALAQDQIVGSIGLIPGRWWFSEAIVLEDRWTYVRKPWRRSLAGRRLLRAAKEYADRVEMPLSMGIFSFDQVDRKNKLFRRYLTPVGESFVYGLEYAAGG